MLAGFAADLRLARRRVLTQPMITGIVILTLGLAVGSATAIFSVADAVLLRPLPFPESDRLVRLSEKTADAGVEGVSLTAFDLWTSGAGSLQSLAFFEPRRSLVVVDDEPDRLQGAMVSRAFFDVMKVFPAKGRTFTAGALAGPPDEVVISHRLWQRLGGTDSVIGRTLLVEPQKYAIVGVMPPDFSYPADAEFWTSPEVSILQIRSMRNLRFFSAIARLREGATVASLQSELDVLTERHPEKDRLGGTVRMVAVGLRDSLVGHVRPGIVVAAAAVALLLIIACSNVTALLLAQASARRRDLAVQSALGASPARLVRERFAEVLLLGVPAGMLGAAAAWICRGTIVALSSDEIPRIDALGVNGRVVLFAVGATLLCALLTTILPALLAARGNPAEGVRAGRGAGQSRGVLRTLGGLMVAEVALTFVIACAGVLLARSFDRLVRVDPGFRSDGVVAARINLPREPAIARDAQVAFYAELARQVRAMPGVESVSYASRLPLSQAFASVDARTPGSPESARAVLQLAGPGYFSTIGAQVLEGREIVHADAAAPVVVINDVLARQLFAGESAIGKRVTFRDMARPVDALVIGVTRAVRYNGLASDILPELYLDYRVRPTIVSIVARTTGSSAAAFGAIREVVRHADPTKRVTVDQMTTLDREVARRLARPRFFLALVGTFATVALVLAAAGLYGVMAFAVAERRHEIGVRLALGASPRQIAREVVRRAALLTGGGLLLGAAGAAGATRAMQSLLFDVSASDAATYAAAALLLAAIAMIACLVPVARARRVNPIEVLRA